MSPYPPTPIMGNHLNGQLGVEVSSETLLECLTVPLRRVNKLLECSFVFSVQHQQKNQIVKINWDLSIRQKDSLQAANYLPLVSQRELV